MLARRIDDENVNDNEMQKYKYYGCRDRTLRNEFQTDFEVFTKENFEPISLDKVQILFAKTWSFNQKYNAHIFINFDFIELVFTDSSPVEKPEDFVGFAFIVEPAFTTESSPVIGEPQRNLADLINVVIKEFEKFDLNDGYMLKTNCWIDGQ